MKNKTNPLKPLTIRLPEPLLKSLQDSAIDSGKSLNQTVIDSLERGLTGLNTALPPDMLKQIEAIAKKELRPLDMQIQFLLRNAMDFKRDSKHK